MIRPRTKVHAELYIHAASAAVWRRFTQLQEWPTWYPDVIATQWREGVGWQEGATFQVQANGERTTQYVIRMVSSESVTVWEAVNPALTVVYSLHCADQVGGCKVTLTATYHGMAALSLWARGQRQRRLTAILAALQQTFERR